MLNRSLIYALTLALAGAIAFVVTGCSSLPKNSVDEIVAPSNDRNWRKSMAVLPHARIHGDKAKIYNIRNFTYLSEEDYVVHYYDEQFDLEAIESVDFVVVPFKQTPSLAHTMMSFGFQDGRYLAVSVEVRLEEGESYSPIAGAMRQFEIIYVVADERDVIKLRTEQRDSDVYVYRTRATPQQSRELFVDVMRRVNSLKKNPEFYDTFMNNCTTNIVTHINHVLPGSVPWNIGVLLPGYSDQLAYDLGLLVDYGGFEATKRRAHINPLAHRYAQNPRFSQLIRGNMPTDRWAEQNDEQIRTR